MRILQLFKKYFRSLIFPLRHHHHFSYSHQQEVVITSFRRITTLIKLGSCYVLERTYLEHKTLEPLNREKAQTFLWIHKARDMHGNSIALSQNAAPTFSSFSHCIWLGKMLGLVCLGHCQTDVEWPFESAKKQFREYKQLVLANTYIHGFQMSLHLILDCTFKFTCNIPSMSSCINSAWFIWRTAKPTRNTISKPWKQKF